MSLDQEELGMSGIARCNWRDPSRVTAYRSVRCSTTRPSRAISRPPRKPPV